jgi:hypothetical protein
MRNPCLRVALLTLACALTACSSSDDSTPIMAASDGTCSAKFAACGGDATGTWTVKSVCSSGTLIDALNAQFNSPECENTFTKATIATSGTVTYGDSDYSRRVQTEITAKLSLTVGCFGTLATGAGLDLQSCSLYAADVVKGLRPGATASATCNYNGATCNCDLVSVEISNEQGTYSVDGSSMTESSSGNAYGYCVKGSELNENGAIAAGISGIATYTKS